MMFWVRLAAILVLLYVIFTAFNMIIRRLLRVEKEKLFSYNHINAQHKRWNWMIRIGFMIVLIPLVMVSSYYDESRGFWQYAPLIGTMVLIVLSEGLKAYMQWRHAENRNDYVYTILQIIFAVCLFLTVIMTNFFGFFE